MFFTDAVFSLDEFTGKLFSNKRFDREAQELYSLEIQAFRVQSVVKRDTSALSTQEEFKLFQQSLYADNFDLSPTAVNTSTHIPDEGRYIRATSRELDTTTVKVIKILLFIDYSSMA